jgi:hypothetical protein
MVAAGYVALIDNFNAWEISVFGGVIVIFLRSKLLPAKNIHPIVAVCHPT